PLKPQRGPRQAGAGARPRADARRSTRAPDALRSGRAGPAARARGRLWWSRSWVTPSVENVLEPALALLVGLAAVATLAAAAVAIAAVGVAVGRPGTLSAAGMKRCGRLRTGRSRRSRGRRTAVDDLVELSAVEPDATALRTIVDLDPLAIAHRERHAADRALHGGDFGFGAHRHSSRIGTEMGGVRSRSSPRPAPVFGFRGDFRTRITIADSGVEIAAFGEGRTKRVRHFARNASIAIPPPAHELDIERGDGRMVVEATDDRGRHEQETREGRWISCRRRNSGAAFKRQMNRLCLPHSCLIRSRGRDPRGRSCIGLQRGITP